MAQYRITDIQSTLKEYAALTNDEKIERQRDAKIGWTYRFAKHTEEELAEGLRENPQLVFMTVEAFFALEGREMEAGMAGKTAVIFPTENKWTPYCSFIPAFFMEERPFANFVRVEI